MENEAIIKLNNMTRRCDTVVYNNKLKPLVIVEYKRPDVTIDQQVFDQIVRYNIVLRVDYLIVSNGLEHFCCKMDYETQKYSFLRVVPEYGELIDSWQLIIDNDAGKIMFNCKLLILYQWIFCIDVEYIVSTNI